MAMNPLRAIDDFLIDRVFQKLADALHRVASCYAIGSFLLLGFALLHFAWWGLGITAGGGFATWLGLLVSLGWIPSAVWQAMKLDRQWSEGRDTLPSMRLSHVWFRLLLVFGLPLDLSTIWLDWHVGRFVMAITDLSWPLCAVGFYFMACTPKRPKRQTKTQLAWGTR